MLKTITSYTIYTLQYTLYLIRLGLYHLSLRTSKLPQPPRRHSRLRRYAFYTSLFILPTLLALALITLRHPHTSKAEWFNDHWLYRQEIVITNNTSEESDVYISFDGDDVIDTSDTDKFQADAGDIRFTKQNGELLPYYIVDHSTPASTDIDVLFDTFIAGNQTIYMYYGNTNAQNGFQASAFSESEASDYTIGTPGSEETTPGPIAYWKFDEGADDTCSGGSNDACDSTEAENDLAKTNATWQTEDLCISGKCLNFDGDGDYLSKSDDSDFDFAAADGFTLSGWFRHGTIATNPDYILTKSEDGTNGGYQVYMASDGDIAFEIDDDSSWDPDDSVTSTSADYDNNAWHHFAAVKDGTTGIYLYLDGQLIASDESIAATGTLANDDTLYIGMDDDGSSNDWDGFLDELKIYPYARSAAEVKADYTGGNASAVLGATASESSLSDGLVGYWPMDETSGTSVADESGSGYDGTLTDAQEAGTAHASDCDTDTLVDDGNNSDLSSTDDVYNGMILYITDDAECALSSDEQRIISDYVGSTTTIEVSTAFSADVDGCDYTIRHQVGGKFGGAVEFDHKNDYIVTSGFSLAATSGRTACAWINPDAYTNDLAAVIRKDSDISLRLKNTGKFNDRIWNSEGSLSSDYTSNTAIPTGTWSHVCVVWDSPGPNQYIKLKFYLDGELDLDQTTDLTDSNGLVGSGSNAVRIGSDEDIAERIFNGLIDEARIYNRALSPKEVRDLYNWAPGPIAHYKLDETSGDAYDSSGNGITLTNANSTPFVPGKYGNAGDFENGSSQQLYTSHDEAHANYHSITIAAWIKPETLTGYVINKRDNYGLRIYSNAPRLQLEATDGSAYYIYGPTISTDTWYHVAGVYNTQTQTGQVYINGVESTASTVGTAPDLLYSETYYGLTLGNISQLSSIFYDGLLDDVRVYNYARTPGQIVEDMNAGHPAPGSPIGSQTIYYNFDETYGTTANDKIGNQNGTVDSNLTWLTASDCKINGCLQWDAAGEEVSIATADDAPVNFNGSEAFSGSAWVYVTTMPGSSNKDAIIAKWDDTNNLANYRLIVENDDADSTGNFEIEIYDESASETITASGSNDTVSEDTWYHVAWTFNGGTAGTAGDLKLYTNGAYTAQNTANASFAGLEDKASDFTIGEYDPGDTESNNTAFTGYIDEVKIYSSALTQDQIKLDYNAGAVLGISIGQNEAGNLSDGAGNPPVAEWKLDENTGSSAYDTSGNGNTGTITQATWQPGKYGSALNFDGSNDVITLATAGDADLDFNGAEDFSVSAWVYINTMPGSGNQDAIISKWDTTNTLRAYRLFVENDDADSTGNFQVEIYDESANQTLTATGSNDTVFTDTWYHVAFTFNGGTGGTADDLLLYVNSTNTDGNAANGSFAGLEDVAADFTAGDYDTNDSEANNTAFAGKIDHVKIWDYDLTQAQISYDYNRGRPIAHYKFDECQGTTAYDSSGNGFDGTITPSDDSGDNDTVGTCGSGTSTEMWNDGTNGKFNSALGFDGTNDYVEVPMNDVLETTADFSVGVWFKTDQDGWMAMVTPGEYVADYDWLYNVAVNDSEQFNCKVYQANSGNSYLDAASPSTVNDNQWHHGVCALKGDTLYNYLDGQLVATDDTTSGTRDTDISGNLFIGKFPWSITYDFNGLLDDIRLYNYALSTNQVKIDYNEGAALRFGD